MGSGQSISLIRITFFDFLSILGRLERHFRPKNGLLHLMGLAAGAKNAKPAMITLRCVSSYRLGGLVQVALIWFKQPAALPIMKFSGDRQ